MIFPSPLPSAAANSLPLPSIPIEFHIDISIRSVSVQDECLTAFNEFRLSKGKTKYIIYKISDNKKDVVVDAVGHDQDYEVFREQLAASKDSQGRPAPRYAVYDVEYELGGGEGKRCAFPD